MEAEQKPDESKTYDERHHIRPGLKPLREGPIHFVLRTAEATLVLPPSREIDPVEAVLHPQE
jgi:hypothetical protein